MKKLAAKLIHSDWQDFNTGTIESAKLVFLDTLGAVIAGLQQEETFDLAGRFHSGGEYSLLGTPFRTDLYSCGLVHGIASVATEMDEGNQFSKGHPAAHVVPVLLTMLQNRKNITGKELLTILIKGYEACSRFGRATVLLPEAHAHGTWGVMGAAATALLADHVSEDEFCDGIQLSATFALPTLWNSALEGKLIRNVYAGHAIEMGIKTLLFLKTKHLAPDNNVSHVFSKVVGREFDFNCLSDYEDKWDIELNYFKPYAFCRYAHSPIDAFKFIVAENNLTAKQIQKVNVYTYSRASTLSNPDYHNRLSAKFSIPFALAVTLYKNKADQSVFVEKYYEDEEIKAFAKKVTVISSEDLEKDYPKIMPAVVEVIDQDGNIYKKRIDIAKGGPDKKLTELELIDKFNGLTETVFSKEKREQIIEFILNLEKQEDISPIFDLCTE